MYCFGIDWTTGFWPVGLIALQLGMVSLSEGLCGRAVQGVAGSFWGVICTGDVMLLQCCIQQWQKLSFQDCKVI